MTWDRWDREAVRASKNIGLRAPRPLHCLICSWRGAVAFNRKSCPACGARGTSIRLPIEVQGGGP